MSRRLDRRYAAVLGVILSLWAVTNDLALFPPDFGEDATTPGPAPEVREAPDPGLRPGPEPTATTSR